MRSSVELILASASSRRCELLAQLGIIYTTYVSNIDETLLVREHPVNYVQRMALAKAKAANKSSVAHLPVLAADTIIAVEGLILGKPKDRRDVKKSIQLLSGREHQVLTGLCLYTDTGMYDSVSETIVKFRELSASEVKAYSLTKEPHGKAGAYAIQGLAASFVDYFIGSYTNVIGLPLLDVQKLLINANLDSKSTTN